MIGELFADFFYSLIKLFVIGWVLAIVFFVAIVLHFLGVW